MKAATTTLLATSSGATKCGLQITGSQSTRAKLPRFKGSILTQDPSEICAAVSAGTEPAHALLFAVESSIKRAAPEAILKRWRQIILTVPFRFEKVGLGEARFWRAQNLREEMVERGVTVKLSIIQRVYDVAGFKANKEASLETTLSPGQVAAAYEKHLKAARGSEPIKESFVDTPSMCTRESSTFLSAAYCWKSWTRSF